MAAFVDAVQLAVETLQQFTGQIQEALDALAIVPPLTREAGTGEDSADTQLPTPDREGRDSGARPTKSEPLDLSSIVPLELHPHPGKSPRDRYRPQRFSEIVGNESTVETLRLYAEDRRCENFLITGPTGTGKTSLAWVYARSILCEARKGGSVEPCGTCSMCLDLEKYGSMQFGSPVDEINVGSFTKPEQAADETLSQISLSPSSVVIVNEADRLLIKQIKLLAILDSKLTVAVFLSSTDLSKFDDQFKSRCVLLSTRRLSRREMLAYVMGICKAESIKASVGEVNEFLEDVGAPRNTQIRDVLKEVGGFVMRKQAGS